MSGDRYERVEGTMEHRRQRTWPIVEGFLDPTFERRAFGLEPSAVRCPLPGAFFHHATDEDYEKVRSALQKTLVREVKKLWEASERRGLERAYDRAHSEERLP